MLSYATSQVPEGSNFYFTTARAVAALTGGYLTSLAGAADAQLDMVPHLEKTSNRTSNKGNSVDL